jgi:60 kDa SS-A/Ro ribonucleoprotein
LRRNSDAEVIPFSDHVVKAELNPRDSVMTNAKILASLPSGGTNCSAPLKYLNEKKANGDMVVYVSDNQSWVDSPCANYGNAATATMKQWAAFKARNAGAKMICIDIQPYGTTQAQGRPDIFNVGGFSDQVFEFIAQVATGETDPDYWVKKIEAVAL